MHQYSIKQPLLYKDQESQKTLMCGALRDLVPFVQFKKREKHPWSSVNFSKINTPPWLFFTFFKLQKWYQIAQRITNVLFIYHRITLNKKVTCSLLNKRQFTIA